MSVSHMITIWINALFGFLTSKQLMSFDLIWCDFIGKLGEICLLFQAYWMIQYDDDYKSLYSKGKEEGLEGNKEKWMVQSALHGSYVQCYSDYSYPFIS